jgi:hypothetical protein
MNESMEVSGHEFLAGGWVLGRVSLEGVGPVVSGMSRSLYQAVLPLGYTRGQTERDRDTERDI